MIDRRVRHRLGLAFGLTALGLVAAGELRQEKSTEKNYLQNPGFEEVDGDSPAYWGMLRIPQDKHAGTRATVRARSGNACLESEVVADGYMQWVQNVKDVPRNQSLQLGGYIKTEGDAEAHIMIQAFDESGKIVATLGTKSIQMAREWKQARSEAFTVPQEAKTVVLRLVASGKGKVWFDDISLSPGR